MIVDVLDDGVGISDSPEKHHHYGLSILAERSRSLNGDIAITRRPEGGTSVKLSFFPQYLAKIDKVS
jgi:two-component system nitrate/nitrite sensor histidine kinase NarX